MPHELSLFFSLLKQVLIMILITDPASITNTTIATEVAQFAATVGFSNPSTAAVINEINGRQQVSSHCFDVPRYYMNLNIPRWFFSLAFLLIGA
jgi:hypothetical protein